MASDEAIWSWLSGRLRAHASRLYAAYQFGSSLDPAARPNDIDLALVSLDGAGEPRWRDTLILAAELRAAFWLAFHIPLSIMVLTPSEWAEVDGVIVRERRRLL
jgi:predicted nucleotidyltransferase